MPLFPLYFLLFVPISKVLLQFYLLMFTLEEFCNKVLYLFHRLHQMQYRGFHIKERILSSRLLSSRDMAMWLALVCCDSFTLLKLQSPLSMAEVVAPSSLPSASHDIGGGAPKTGKSILIRRKTPSELRVSFWLAKWFNHRIVKQAFGPYFDVP